MNVRIRIIGLALLSLCFSRSILANQLIEMPARSLGTGKHDFYSLGAFVGRQPAKYVLSIAAHKLIDTSETSVTTEEGKSLLIEFRGYTKTLFQRSDIIQTIIPRSDLEGSTKIGLTLLLKSKHGVVKLLIPSSEITGLLKLADREDRYRENEEQDREIADRAIAAKKLIEEARARYLAENPNISKVIADSIRDQKLCVGMNYLDAVASFGSLWFNSRSDGVGGATEFYSHNDGTYSWTLYFIDGKLVRWNQDMNH